MAASLLDAHTAGDEDGASDLGALHVQPRRREDEIAAHPDSDLLPLYLLHGLPQPRGGRVVWAVLYGELKEGRVVGVALGQRVPRRGCDGEAAGLLNVRHEDVEPLAWEELASAISACRKRRWERSRQYVEAVLIYNVEPERLDAVVDSRHLTDRRFVQIMAARLAGGALLVTDAPRLGRARRGHAAAVTPGAVLGDDETETGTADGRVQALAEGVTEYEWYTPLHSRWLEENAAEWVRWGSSLFPWTPPCRSKLNGLVRRW